MLYDLRGLSHYFHGYMVPSTGYLRHFGLIPYPPGFILRFPTRSSLELEPAVDYPKLIHVFREYGHTLHLLGIEDVGALDDAIQAGRTNEIILVAEALHEQRIARIATQIAEQSEQVRLVLIAGPSSSGKTTFSKRLAVQLLANGVRPIAVELDSYFVDREQTPRDEQGNYDFERAGGARSEAVQPAAPPIDGWRRGDAAEVQLQDRQARAGEHDPARPRPDPDRRGDPRAESAAAAATSRPSASFASMPPR